MTSPINLLRTGLAQQIKQTVQELLEKVQDIKSEHKEDEDGFVCPFFKIYEDVFKMSDEERYQHLMKNSRPIKFYDFH